MLKLQNPEQFNQ